MRKPCSGEVWLEPRAAICASWWDQGAADATTGLGEREVRFALPPRNFSAPVGESDFTAGSSVGEGVLKRGVIVMQR